MYLKKINKYLPIILKVIQKIFQNKSKFRITKHKPNEWTKIRKKYANFPKIKNSINPLPKTARKLKISPITSQIPKYQKKNQNKKKTQKKIASKFHFKKTLNFIPKKNHTINKVSKKKFINRLFQKTQKCPKIKYQKES